MKEVELKIKIDWCIEQHHQTNHFYDEYLPYEFHLRMVAQAAKDFERLLTPGSYYHHTIILACYGHDLIEDTRVSYNDVKEVLGIEVADIVYACSNEKGKNRKERANDKYYEGIRNTPGAVFVKLCDRIANVQYSKMTKSRMFEMYKKENDGFGKQLGVWEVPGYSQHEFFPLFAYLKELFES
jgi:(p)ppGpp synthase/HD superfamily hydrolase